MGVPANVEGTELAAKLARWGWPVVALRIKSRSRDQAEWVVGAAEAPQKTELWTSDGPLTFIEELKRPNAQDSRSTALWAKVEGRPGSAATSATSQGRASSA